MLKKAITAIIATSLLLSGCSTATTQTETIQQVEHTTYMVAGRYYTCGELITKDGNVWGYTQDVISDKPSYDNQPVFALMDDMGTANNIDDEVLGLIFDVETAIYDELEIRLAEEFSVSRDGNNLHLDPQQ